MGAKADDDIDFAMKSKSRSSNHKLLEQMLGRKAAQGHRAAKARPEARSGVQQRSANEPQVRTLVESEDEEEGRAGMIKSKSAKNGRRQAAPSSTSPPKPPTDRTRAEVSARKRSASPEEEDREPRNVQKGKRKGGSYLDEILAQKSKKKKGGKTR